MGTMDHVARGEPEDSEEKHRLNRFASAGVDPGGQHPSHRAASVPTRWIWADPTSRGELLPRRGSDPRVNTLDQSQRGATSLSLSTRHRYLSGLVLVAGLITRRRR